MKELAGKTAVVTGSGSGIGRGTALALAEAGMNVVVADVDEPTATAVANEISNLGVRSLAVVTDVADRASVETLADKAWSEFGAVHVLHNNAGVALFFRLDAMTDTDWRWILSINLEGVINGLQAFLPRLKTVEGEGHIVNTASLAGMFAAPTLGAYNATKFAVVAISETLRDELAPEGIGVSVLCPGVVGTNIMANTVRDRPAGGPDMQMPAIPASEIFGNIMTPEEAGKIVRHGILNDEPYIFTHPEFEPVVRARFERIMQSFQRAKEREF
jgi:NAD(P)-dependent dehydrogenase (short-subunit alcohol dehydrogenase family)